MIFILDNILYESLVELNKITAEINSECVYESILLESESDNNKSSFFEKVKAVWKKFVKAMKNMIKSCIDFIRKNILRIKDKEKKEEKVIIEDHSVLLEQLKKLYYDFKSNPKETIEKISISTNSYVDIFERIQKTNCITLPREKAIRVLEKNLADANKYIEDFDKTVDDIMEYVDNLYDADSEESLNEIIDRHKVNILNISRNYIKKLVNNIADDLKEVTAGINTNKKED